MKRFHLNFILILSSFVLFTSCDLDVAPDLLDEEFQQPRGRLLEKTLLVALQDKDAVADYMDTFDEAIKFLFPPKNGVDLYKLTYETIDAWGAMTTASGIVAFPNTGTGPYPVAAYQHGTIVEKSNAPSGDGGEKIIAVGLAADGYVVSMTDYLGLGDSPGLHPYVHAKTEASAGLDMLRAVREFTGKLNVALNDQLFIFGYSQGGHGAMALHKEIQENHSDEFTVTASAPMSGPYDLSGVQAEVIVQELPYPTPYYLPYVLLAYSEVYSVMKIEQSMAEPYLSTIPPLFDGMSSSSEIDALMPEIPNKIIRPEVLQAFKTDPNHFFRNALKDNDIYDWKPEAPVRLLYCEGDEQVSYLNSIVAYNKFVENGVTDVEHININSNFGHGECAIPCMQEAKDWFDTMKE